MESSSPLLSAIKYKREMLTLTSPQRWEVRKQSPCSIPQKPRECLGVADRLCPERQLYPQIDFPSSSGCLASLSPSPCCWDITAVGLPSEISNSG